MKNFLIYTLATITGIILASFLMFFIMLASLSMMVASGDKPVTVTDNSILVLKGGNPIPDRGDTNPLSGFDILSMSLTPTPGLNDILNNLKKFVQNPCSRAFRAWGFFYFEKLVVL